MFTPIIKSLLDTDLYKYTMQQVVLHQFPATTAEYAFKCRNTPQYPLSELKTDLIEQLEYLCTLRFTPAELDYLRSLYFMKSDFVDYLENFQLKGKHILVTEVGDTLDIRVPAGTPMLAGMPFEIFTLGIVNELYFRRFATEEVMAEGERRLTAKINYVREYMDRPDNRCANPFEFFDFGTRRRFSRTWHEHVVRRLQRELGTYFKGTSNVDLARRFGLTPIGSMAHEFLQSFQAAPHVRLRDFQRAALEAWVAEYRGDLDIALTDVVGMDAFFHDFDRYFAKLFDGLRHDSGDPYLWGEKAIARYRELRVNPSDKRLVFSDGLKVDSALRLYSSFADRISTGFGIGTNLTNDLGPEPLQIVMKMVSSNGLPVAKLSDSPGKTMSTDDGYIRYLESVFHAARLPMAFNS